MADVILADMVMADASPLASAGGVGGRRRLVASAGGIGGRQWRSALVLPSVVG